MEGFEKAWNVADPIDGWLARSQAEALFGAAGRVVDDSSIVEIGSHHGKSTVVLALGKSPSTKLTAVDPFEDPRWGGGMSSLDAFRTNLENAGLEDSVVLVRSMSRSAAQAWDGSPIGLLYIDGAHDRGSVLTDIDGWSPHLSEDSRIYVHDAFSAPGVTLALLQRFFGSTTVEYVGSIRTLAMFRRQQLGPKARLRSSARLLGRLWFFGRNILIKLSLRRGSRRVPALLGHDGTHYPY